ncbi:Uncharacterised protein [uncultured archaeon]|nr:Uncharacterised protein [uncultured archaeon]
METMKKLILIPLLLIIQASAFDMSGTIVSVNSATSLTVNDKTINLDGVDTSGLNRCQMSYLMNDLGSWLPGKDVLVQGNYVYFDLVGSYNSVSINEQIQNEIRHIKTDLVDYCCTFCERY